MPPPGVNDRDIWLAALTAILTAAAIRGMDLQRTKPRIKTGEKVDSWNNILSEAKARADEIIA